MRYLSEATGPSAPFEKPRTEAYLSRSRKRPFARLVSTFVQSARELFAKADDSRIRTPSLRLDQGTKTPDGPAAPAAASETIQ
jgi:hypothetical protein